MTDPERDTVLVTGGGGFLGSAIVRGLRQRGVLVRSLARRRRPSSTRSGVVQIQGDVADPAVVSETVKGCSTVFHVAAKAGLWGPYSEYHRVNVVGTENVIAACRRHGVRRLIYTSSPSVVFTGHDLEGVDESVPYAPGYDAAYPATKAIAEKTDPLGERHQRWPRSRSVPTSSGGRETTTSCRVSSPWLEPGGSFESAVATR